MPIELKDLFRRTRVPSRDREVVVVRTTCKHCGESMVLDVREGLEAVEQAHTKKCDQTRELISPRTYPKRK